MRPNKSSLLVFTVVYSFRNDNTMQSFSVQLKTKHIFSFGGAKVQVTGHRSGHRPQARSQVRPQATGQVTGQITGHTQKQ